MSEEKCFCHLNGYKVKDADARVDIAKINEENTVRDTTIHLLAESVNDHEKRVTALENTAPATGESKKLYAHYYSFKHSPSMMDGCISFYSTNGEKATTFAQLKSLLSGRVGGFNGSLSTIVDVIIGVTVGEDYIQLHGKMNASFSNQSNFTLIESEFAFNDYANVGEV